MQCGQSRKANGHCFSSYHCYSWGSSILISFFFSFCFVFCCCSMLCNTTYVAHRTYDYKSKSHESCALFIKSECLFIELNILFILPDSISHAKCLVFGETEILLLTSLWSVSFFSFSHSPHSAFMLAIAVLDSLFTINLLHASVLCKTAPFWRFTHCSSAHLSHIHIKTIGNNFAYIGLLYFISNFFSAVNNKIILLATFELNCFKFLHFVAMRCIFALQFFPPFKVWTYVFC